MSNSTLVTLLHAETWLRQIISSVGLVSVIILGVGSLELLLREHGLATIGWCFFLIEPYRWNRIPRTEMQFFYLTGSHYSRARTRIEMPMWNYFCCWLSLCEIFDFSCDIIVVCSGNFDPRNCPSNSSGGLRYSGTYLSKTSNHTFFWGDEARSLITTI